MHIKTSFLCFVKHVVYRWILQEEPKLRVGHLKKKKKLMVWIQSESLDPKLGDAGIIIEYSQSTINIYSLQKNRPVPAFFSQRFYKPP